MNSKGRILWLCIKQALTPASQGSKDFLQALLSGWGCHHICQWGRLPVALCTASTLLFNSPPPSPPWPSCNAPC